MPLKNNRNSRDDKSEKSNKSARSASDHSSKKSYSKPSRADDANSTKKKSFGDDAKRSFKSGYKKTDTNSFSTEKRSPKSFSANREEGKSFGRSANKDERRTSTERPERKPFNADKAREERKPFGGKNTFAAGKSYTDKSPGDKKPYDARSKSERKPFDEKKFDDKRLSSDRRTDKEARPERKPYSDRPQGERKPFGDKKFGDKNSAPKRFNDKPFKSRIKDEPTPFEGRYYRPDDGKWNSEERLKSNNRSKKPTPQKDDGLIRLNRYIANAGICSRRKADELIAAGVVSVNGEPVTELGFKIDPSKDVIRYNGETLKREKMVYVLLNKPKDYITTTDDPQERKTVMSLVEKASRERIYPVGRLDRNTTGLLLMTNDGDLAEKLSHPRNNVTKIYQVELNRNVPQGDLNKIEFGLELEDGLIKPDQVSYVAGGSKKEIGIQIHSGKNRIVRRIFEHLGYEVVKLDRVVYSNLTKKDLPRGRWRYLEEKEIIQLKHLIK